MVTGFADTTGRYLPLPCALNGPSELALRGESGAHGVTLLPYFEEERTPNRPDATGVFRGLTTDTTREDIARATVEGILCSMRDAVVPLENTTQQ
ncbi:MAG: FGGY-family carbohydrate kinase [Corynebacterium pyruviciproducens]|uniref:FGGY-family carbohydrate kinase n=1 Tax=Corynebacterium pyruviciproducens TaxID=598660 RepID=UPI003983A0FA